MEVWNNNDLYLIEHLAEEDNALKNALVTSRENNLPEWEVSATQGKFLYLLAKMKNAKRILEIGTLGGYSTIWLARAGRVMMKKRIYRLSSGTKFSLYFSAAYVIFGVDI